MNNPHDWNPTNDPQIAIALRLVWGHCAEIHRGQTPDEWRVSMGAVEVLSLVEYVRAEERERCARVAEEFLTKGRSPLGRSVAAAIRGA